MSSAMRRTIILLALAVSGGLLASCGKGAHPVSGGQARTATSAATTSPGARSASTVTHLRALAFAAAVNLTSADVPGFTTAAEHKRRSSGEQQLEREMLQCAGLGDSGEAIAQKSSQSFQLKRGLVNLGVSSEVSVEPSAAQAVKGLTVIRSAHVRGCFSRYLSLIFKSQQLSGATAGPVTIQSGNPPAPGTSGGFGWRVTASFKVRGITVPIYLDFLGFVDGQSEVTLLSSGLLRPFPAAVQQQLFSLLISRAQEHRL
jgi:hypothetical protein